MRVQGKLGIMLKNYVSQVFQFMTTNHSTLFLKGKENDQ